jgi:Phage tail tube protein, GTA-gp10
MINRARGEVPLLIEGEPHRLCLTLGALAEIEAGLGLDDLAQLEARLKRPRMQDILVILTALLRGGGHELGIGDVERRCLDLKAAGKAIAEAFMAAGEMPE